MRAIVRSTGPIGLGLACLCSTACPESAATPAAEATSSDTTGATSDTTAASTADTTTTGTAACVACEPWQTCVDGTCEPVPGRCAGDDECAPGQLCDLDHACDDACNVLRCPEHAQCVADDAAAQCSCDDGWFANADKCVDRIRFALPMDNPDASLIGEVIGFDNDPAVGQSDLDCLSYDGQPFPRCYDDHTGTDFLLLGGFTTMDSGSAAVFAAADGEVVFVHDGEYDRCALDLQAQQVLCEDGGPVTPANAITVLHADGVATRYLHLMKDSIVVAQGDHVTCGQPMALVGSSGNSSAPHLHFEVLDTDGAPVDAYAGRYSHPESYWAEQGADDELPGAACQ